MLSGPHRQAAERQAMNAGIQGLAADIFKSALVRLDHRLRDDKLQARLILQVHDEVLVEAPPDEKERVSAIMLDALENRRVTQCAARSVTQLGRELGGREGLIRQVVVLFPGFAPATQP